MKKTPLELGKRERQIIETVQRLGEASVSDVRGNLDDPPSYSAVRTMLGLLVEKGWLKFRPDGKRYLYRTAMSRAFAAHGPGAAAGNFFWRIGRRRHGRPSLHFGPRDERRTALTPQRNDPCLRVRRIGDRRACFFIADTQSQGPWSWFPRFARLLARWQRPSDSCRLGRRWCWVAPGSSLAVWATVVLGVPG